MQAQRIVLRQFVGTGFQVLFHSPPGVLFTFPSQYYTLSVTEWYLALRGGPRLFPRNSSCFAVLWILPAIVGLRVRDSHPFSSALPKLFHCPIVALCSPKPHHARTMVWALPRSLAATYGITFVFSSSGYLDVSVHRVPSVYLCIQHTVTVSSSAGFPHSDICGSRDICSSPQLFAAYHVFLRPSVPRHPSCALLCLTSQIPLLRHSVAVLSSFSLLITNFRFAFLLCVVFQTLVFLTFSF